MRTAAGWALQALARELDQAADPTVRAMDEVVSASAALAVYRRDQDVPPWTGLPTAGCHLALARRVVEHQEDHMIRIRNRITRRELLATAASGCALSAFGSLAKPYLSFAAERPLVSHGVQSGDVCTDAGMVWARADRPSRILAEIATSDSFKDIRHGVF